MQNFWSIVLLVLITRTPFILLPSFIHHREIFLSLAIGIGGIFLINAKAAALLGILGRHSLGQNSWKAGWSSALTHTGTLFRVTLLLGLYSIPILLVIGVIARIFGHSQFIGLVGMALFLIFLKYALADPLVVVENWSAVEALRRSWKMTKGHFGYVAGCYLIMGGAEWLVTWGLSSPVPEAGSGFNWGWIVTRLVLSLVETTWVILSWCMYLRIKEADEEQLKKLEEDAAQAWPV